MSICSKHLSFTLYSVPQIIQPSFLPSHTIPPSFLILIYYTPEQMQGCGIQPNSHAKTQKEALERPIYTQTQPQLEIEHHNGTTGGGGK